MMPLQLRLPRAEVRAIKIAAAEREQTLRISYLRAFMLTSKKRSLRKASEIALTLAQ